MFVPTGSLANLVALMTHTRPGDQILVDDASHILWSEGQGYAHICGLAARPLPHEGGFVEPDRLRAAIDEHRFGHRPRTTLLCLENTHNGSGGRILDPSRMEAMADVADSYGIAIHLDGARLLNAAAATDVPPTTLAEQADGLAQPEQGSERADGRTARR